MCSLYVGHTHHLCLKVVEFHHGHHGVVPCFDALGRDNFNAFANGAAACGQRRLGGGGNGWGRPGMGLERWPVGWWFYGDISDLLVDITDKWWLMIYDTVWDYIYPINVLGFDQRTWQWRTTQKGDWFNQRYDMECVRNWGTPTFRFEHHFPHQLAIVFGNF